MTQLPQFIGIDVGTQSVRSSLIDNSGIELVTCCKSLTVFNCTKDHYEQSCEEIWEAICFTIKTILKAADNADISGIGFDATCSLVVTDSLGKPLSISQDGIPERTCLMWMDHRASAEACEVNSIKSPVLDYVGGGFSPEQQPPKLLWIKKNLPDIWKKAENFFDLPDWLTYRATGSLARSLCSVTCKWGYVSHRGGWDRKFLEEIGLGELSDCQKLGKNVLSPGMSIPGGLSANAAIEMGLVPNTPVGISMIDAHSGTLAMLSYSKTPSESLCIISGTSTCIMGLSDSEKLVTGIWGPYQDVILPGSWLFEGGQTAAGNALDHILKSHPAYTSDMSFSFLNSKIGDLSAIDPCLHGQSAYVHIQPDLHGNRSPLALPWFRGMISGLDLSSDFQNLLLIYLTTLQGLALGIQLVVEKLKQHGIDFNRIIICGGLADNSLYNQILATVTKLPVIRPKSANMMCKGSALLAKSAATGKSLHDIIDCRDHDSLESDIFYPVDGLIKFYRSKYKVFHKMTHDQIEYRNIMNLLS